MLRAHEHARACRLLAMCSIAIALPTLAIGCGSSTGGATRSSTSATTKTSSNGSSLKVARTPAFATPSSSSPVRSGVVHVAYRDITIQPDTLRVKVGTTVVWTNYDSVEDDVRSVGGGPQRISSKSFGEGESFSVVLRKAGVIHYVSSSYPTTMNGTIEVLS